MSWGLEWWGKSHQLHQQQPPSFCWSTLFFFKGEKKLSVWFGEEKLVQSGRDRKKRTWQKDGRDRKKFSPQTVTSALHFLHVWLTQTSRPARFICFPQDETRSLVQPSAPPLWHCVPDDVILVSRALQTGCWWYKQSAGEGQDAFKAIWVCRLLCWKPPSMLNVTRQHTRKAHMCVHNLMHSYRGSPPRLYGINQSFKKYTRPLEALFTPQVSSPSFTHTCRHWWQRLRATCSTGAVTIHTCTYTTWATTAPKLLKQPPWLKVRRGLLSPKPHHSMLLDPTQPTCHALCVYRRRDRVIGCRHVCPQVWRLWIKYGCKLVPNRMYPLVFLWRSTINHRWASAETVWCVEKAGKADWTCCACSDQLLDASQP